jgi:hypothetical protein
VPLIVRGIIPTADAERLKAAGVAAVYTPKDFEINGILGAIVGTLKRVLRRSVWSNGKDRRARQSSTPDGGGFYAGARMNRPAVGG